MIKEKAFSVYGKGAQIPHFSVCFLRWHYPDQVRSKLTLPLRLYTDSHI